MLFLYYNKYHENNEDFEYVNSEAQKKNVIKRPKEKSKNDKRENLIRGEGKMSFRGDKSIY